MSPPRSANSIAHLARITIYPIKSLHGVDVEHATLLPCGALEHDRRFALFDRQGFVNGKRTNAVHRLRTSVDLAEDKLELTIGFGEPGEGARIYRLDSDQTPLTARLREYFHLDESARLAENVSGGFPDDIEAPGPTIVSTATLDCVAGWFPGLTVDEIRRRFRANLEIGGVEPFWEDRLYAEADQVVRFQLGDAALEGVNPCRRCVVPTRDSLTGEVGDQFAKQFAARRQQSLPPWAARSRFDHFYRLAVNTRAPQGAARCRIRVGSPLDILGTFPKDF
ncbi:MAG TPA: MOSC N-terminal beta barrel domain-containing protein [Pirellulales bacterium]|nr:MOSC N-terminal beta barrel domain-containing protein [Pirellulales bacterium]